MRPEAPLGPGRSPPARPAALYSVGDEVEAEVTQVDAREKRIGLSIKALRRTEERGFVESGDGLLKRRVRRSS